FTVDFEKKPIEWSLEGPDGKKRTVVATTDPSFRCPEEGVVCGNGTKEGTEQCDDGNTSSGDGCDSRCQIEESFCPQGVLDILDGSKGSVYYWCFEFSDGWSECGYDKKKN
ncbi:MAG: DUF4215 domain-containing protein, partial [Nanoarchaeota archaeon]|nr:DUF4215 domain-containing protein [Nanoarchaeota archaeon]